MIDGGTAALAGFVMASTLTVLFFLLLSGSKSRLDARLKNLGDREGPSAPAPSSVAQLAQSALPKMGNPLVPKDQEERTRLQTRLIHAGLYERQAMHVFLGVKVLLMVSPAVIGLLAGCAGIVPVAYGVLGGALLGVIGMIGPSFWLDNRKAARQTQFRRSLPDVLDVLVICLEGGLSLRGAIRRVASELQTAHPQLASELNILQREMQMGLTPGDALKQFSERCDLEEIRSLGSVVTQAERFGASLVKALRVHAEVLRQKRLQHAEQMAQKAATKILFPTILFIFPGIFIVILGPAVIHILEMFSKMGQ